MFLIVNNRSAVSIAMPRSPRVVIVAIPIEWFGAAGAVSEEWLLAVVAESDCSCRQEKEAVLVSLSSFSARLSSLTVLCILTLCTTGTVASPTVVICTHVSHSVVSLVWLFVSLAWLFVCCRLLALSLRWMWLEAVVCVCSATAFFVERQLAVDRASSTMRTQLDSFDGTREAVERTAGAVVFGAQAVHGLCEFSIFFLILFEQAAHVFVHGLVGVMHLLGLFCPFHFSIDYPGDGSTCAARWDSPCQKLQYSVYHRLSTIKLTI